MTVPSFALTYSGHEGGPNGPLCHTLMTKKRYIRTPNQLTKFSASAHVSVLLYFSLTVKAATLIFISGCGSAISSAKEGKSGFIYNLVKS